MKEKELIDNLKSISKSNNLKLFFLYTYNLKDQPKSKAVRFVYLLKGRKSEEGIIKEFKGQFLAPGCFIIPDKKDKEIQDIFAFWKIPHKRKPILMN